MIVFAITALLITAGVLIAVLTPLVAAKPLRGARRDSAVAAVCRDQLRELEQDLAAGAIERSRYAEARDDIERRLLADLHDADQEPERASRSHRSAIAVGLTLPVFAAGLYWAVGSPQSIEPRRAAAVEAPHALDGAEVQARIARLAARLEREPGDAEGWTMLARSYTALRRYADAASAYAQAAARGKPDAQFFADYADALAMTQGRRFQGKPEALIAQALSLDPDHVKALALAGSAAFERREYEAAVGHWQRLLTRVPADADIARSIRGSIAQARARANEASARR